MKKRILGLLLAFCMLAGLIPQISLNAQAVEVLPAAPNPGVEYGEVEQVRAGTIRYVSQLSYMDTFYPSYWGDYADAAGHECYTACISMALSYIGANATPQVLGDYWLAQGYTGGYPFATTPHDVAEFHATCSELPLGLAVANYQTGSGKYSPPILHLTTYSANGHYVVLAGQMSDTVYLAIDPADDTPWRISIQDGIATYTHGGATRSEPITTVTQFYSADGGFGRHEDGTFCPSGAFADMPIETNWAHAGIDFCVERSLLVGVGDGRFMPETKMTRAMLTCVLYRLAGAPDVADLATPFQDLKADWYRAAIAWAYQESVVAGMSENTFAPDATVTREQMVTMLYRFLILSEKPEEQPELNGYTDAARVSEWARPAMRWAVANGILCGMTETTLVPHGSATREQVAAILMRYCALTAPSDTELES